MIDNFNFKNFLFENKLGAYAKVTDSVNEDRMNEEEHDAWSDYRRGAAPRPKGKDPRAMTFAQAKDAVMWKGLERDLGSFPYKIASDPKITSAEHYVNVLNVVLKKKGKSLKPDQVEALKNYWTSTHNVKQPAAQSSAPSTGNEPQI